MNARIGCFLIVFVLLFSACQSPEPKPTESPWQQTVQMPSDDPEIKKEKEDQAILLELEQLEQAEKLLAYEQKVAVAEIKLAFFQQSLQLAEKRVLLLKGEQEDKSWWPSKSRWKLSQAQRAVEKAEDELASAKRKLERQQTRLSKR